MTGEEESKKARQQVEDALGCGCALTMIAICIAAVILPLWVCVHFIMKWW